METKQLLSSLLGAVCIGHINEAMQIAEDYLKDFATITENKGFVRAEINKGADRTIMLDAHIDEVGMIVTSVLEGGFLAVTSVGSLDTRIIPAMPVKVLGKKTVFGVFTSIPGHLKTGDTVPSFDNCYIDVGENAEFVSVGDFVTFDVEPLWLKNDRITSKALDNRAGVVAVLEAAKKIAQTDCKANAVILLTAGEELGLRGAKTASFVTKADENISVDVSFGDYPDIAPHKTAKLQSGTMIGISPVLERNIYKKLEQLASINQIPYTLEVMGGTTSTNADAISISGSGIPSGLLSIPLRNMHTPCEVIALKDILATAELIYLYVKEGGMND